MPTTAWGSPITFGWEFEGTDSTALWRWFESTTRSVTSEGWTRAPEAQRVAWIREGLLQRRADTWPSFIDRLLPDRQVYELTSKPCSEVSVLKQQLLTIHDLLDPTGDYSPFHARVADRLRANAPTPENGGRGPTRPEASAANNYLEDAGKTKGKMPRKYKYSNVGLRDFYDASDTSIVGFELRKGVHDSLERLIACVSAIVESLHTDAREIALWPNVFPEQRPSAGAPRGRYSLEEHYAFSRPDKTPLAADANLLRELRQEAQRVVLDGGRTPTRSDWLRLESDPNAGKETWKRWLMAFKPWEQHPAIRDDEAAMQLIASLRRRMIANLTTYFGIPEPRRSTLRFPATKGRVGMPPASGFAQLDYVSLEIHDFVAKIRPHLFM